MKMDAVHWFALLGMAGIVFGAWAIARAWDIEARSHQNFMRQTEQLRMIREATALARYGAREEAEQLLEDAIALAEKPTP
jgi:hypothetical protein